MRKLHSILIIGCFLAVSMSVLLAGCGAKKIVKDKNPLINQVSIVTSFYPIYIETLNVTSGIAGVHLHNMTKPTTGCLHDYQASPKEIAALEGSNVFIANGVGMETFIDEIRKNYPKISYIDASAAAKPIVLNGVPNPHIWVSIDGNISQVREIASKLADADPLHAVQYKRNADAYIAKLEKLRTKMHLELDKYKGTEIITFHEAFPYFTREFGFKTAAVIERDPGSQPSAGELANIIKIANEKGVRCIFAEPQYPQGSAEAIARETHAKVYILDPAVTGPLKADAYIQAMENNLAVLAGALKPQTSGPAIQ